MHKILRHEDYARDFYNRIRNNDRMYRAVGEERMQQEPGKPRANTSTLEFHRVVESVTSATDAVTFGDDPWFQPWSDELFDDMLKAIRDTQAVMEQQHDDMNLRIKAMNGIRSGILHGTMFAHLKWTEKVRWRDVGDEFRPYTMYDGPEWVHIPLWKAHFEPGVSEIEDMEWFSFEYEISRTELQELVNEVKRGQESGDIQDAEVRDVTEVENVLNLSFIVDGAPVQYTSEGWRVSEQLSQARGYEGDLRPGKFHIDEYWGIHPLKKNPNDPNGQEAMPVFHRILIVNGREWIIDMPNPYAHGALPFIKVGFLPNEDDVYALGMGDLLQNKVTEINERRNLGLDILTMSLFGMWQRTGVEPGRGTTRVRMFPGKIFDQLADGVMTPIQVNTSGLSAALRMDAVDIEEMRGASAATANVQGLQQGGTATEIRNIATESNRRIATYAIIFAAEALKKFLWFQAEMNRQFLPAFVTVGIPNEAGIIEGTRISRENIFHRARFKMKVAIDLESRPRLLRNINQTMQLLGTTLQASPDLLPVIKPTLIQLMKKVLLLFKINPEQALPAEKIEEVLTAAPAGGGVDALLGPEAAAGATVPAAAGGVR